MLAAGVSALAAASCVVAVALAWSLPRFAAAAAALATLIAVLCLGRKARAGDRLLIETSGAIRCGDAAGPVADIDYCSPHFVCLSFGGRRLPLWPDGLPASGWRRLIVAARWPHGVAPADQPAGARTK